MKVNNTVWEDENLNTLEKAKFDIDDGNDVIVRTSAKGTFTVAGMVDFLVTTQDITDVASELPAIAMAGRKSISIINISGDPVFIGPTSAVSATNDLGTNAGWPISSNGYLNFDLAGIVKIFAIAEAGKTVRLKIKEFK